MKHIRTLLGMALMALVLAAGSTRATLAYLTAASEPVINRFEPAQAFELTYDANAGSETVEVPDPQLTYKEGKFKISDKVPVRPGYSFLTWNTDKDGIGTDVAPEENYTTGQPKTTLYAQWRAHTHSFILTFHVNGGDDILVGGISKGSEYSDETVDVGVLELRLKRFAAGLDVTAVRDGFDLVGWAESSETTEAAYAIRADGKIADVIQIACDDHAECPDETVHEKHLYAVWADTSNEYKVVYHENGGANGPGEEIAEDEGPSHTFNIKGPHEMTGPTADHVFLGWSEDPEAAAPTYGYQGVNYVGDTTLESTITLTAPRRVRHLYAIWGLKYSITFDPNEAIGGYGNVPGPIWVVLDRNREIAHISSDDFQVTIADGYIDAKLPVRDDETNVPTRDDDYYFGWWGLEPDNFTEDSGYQFADTIRMYNTLPQFKLYAFYKPYGETKLTFDKNTTDTVQKMPEPMANSLTPSLWIFDLPDNEPIRNNYQFMGWSHDKMATVPEYQPGDEYILNKIKDHRPTLYAIWKPKHAFRIYFYANNPDSRGTATIHYVSNAGNPATTTNNAYITCAVTTDETYTWTKEFWQERPYYCTMDDTTAGSYEFLGWAYSSKATVPDYTVDENGCIEQDVETAEPNTVCRGGTHYTYLYAVWKKTPRHTFNLYFVGYKSNSNDYNVAINTVDRITGEREYVSSTIYSTQGGSNTSQRYYVIFRGETVDTTVDHWTWDQEFWETHSPVSTRKTTATAKYKLIGWSYKSPASNSAAVPDIPVDSDGIIRQDITIEEPLETCTGTTHDLLLWPVYKLIPLHTFNLYFHTNLAYDSKAAVYFQTYDEATQTWVKGNNAAVSGTGSSGSVKNIQGVSVSFSNHPYQRYTSETVGTDEDHWTWNAEFWSQYGVRAFKEDAADFSYTFKGWAYTPDATEPDISMDERGFINQDITIRESDCAESMHCTDTAGQNHNLILYAVWDKRPLNSFRISFVANGGNYVRYRSGNYWYNGNSRIDPCNAVDREGTVYRLPTTYTTYSYEVRSLDAATNPSYTWTTDYWSTRGLHATRPSTDGIHYTFMGWAFEKNATEPDIHVNEDGYIIEDIVQPAPNDGSHGYYTMVLYAVWKETPVHSFTLQFYRNGGRYVYYRNEDNTRFTYTGTNNYTVTTGEIPVTQGVSSHTWDVDFWNRTGVYATRDQTNDYSFKFLGWARNSQQTYPDYPVTEDGQYISVPITIEDENGDGCQGAKHLVNLYAIWEPVPRTRNYVLSFNANGGSGAPDPITQYETFDTVAWKGSTFTMPTQIPTRQRFMFVGWAESKNATIGTYGYPNEANPDIKTATQYLLSEYYIPTNTSESNRKKTLYAIWRYEFETIYDANGGTHATSMRHDYTTLASCTLRVEDDEVLPVREGYTFLGWSRDPEATDPEYTHDASLGYPTQLVIEGNSDGYTRTTLYAVWRENTVGGMSVRPLSTALNETDEVPAEGEGNETLPPAEGDPIDPTPGENLSDPLDPQSNPQETTPTDPSAGSSGGDGQTGDGQPGDGQGAGNSTGTLPTGTDDTDPLGGDGNGTQTPGGEEPAGTPTGNETNIPPVIPPSDGDGNGSGSGDGNEPQAPTQNSTEPQEPEPPAEPSGSSEGTEP